MPDAREQEIEAFRPADHADIADEELAALAPFGIRREALDAGEIRTGTHHENALGRHPAALDGNAAVGFVGGDGDVGSLEGELLGEPQQMPKDPAPAELRLVEFRVGVVMVEHEALSRENLEEKPDQEDEVGRIAGMDHVEAVAPPHLEREHELPEQRDRVFDEIGRCAPRLDRQGMAIDPDAVDHLVRALIAGALGADHRHLVTRIAERGRLRPGTAVERNREVLHHDQHSELTPHRSTSQESRAPWRVKPKATL